MWKYEFLAQEQVKHALDQAQRHREAQVTRGAEEFRGGGRAKGVLYRASVRAHALATRATNAALGWQVHPSDRSGSVASPPARS